MVQGEGSVGRGGEKKAAKNFHSQKGSIDQMID